VLGDIRRGGMKLKLVFARQVGNKFSIRVRLASSQLVIQMDDGENNAEFIPDLEQQAQHGNRIGTAGDGYTYTVAGVEQVMAADIIQDSLR
jgi:hypothetical protein